MRTGWFSLFLVSVTPEANTGVSIFEGGPWSGVNGNHKENRFVEPSRTPCPSRRMLRAKCVEGFGESKSAQDLQKWFASLCFYLCAPFSRLF